MGYKVLKTILRRNQVTARDCSQACAIDVTRLYHSFEIGGIPLTEKEKDRIFSWLQENKFTHLTREEVFNTDASNQYEFDTVYKSEAIARSKRRSAHKR